MYPLNRPRAAKHCAVERKNPTRSGQSAPRRAIRGWGRAPARPVDRPPAWTACGAREWSFLCQHGHFGRETRPRKAPAL